MAVKIKPNQIDQSVKVPEPIFKVKTNVDLFDLYGSSETLENKKKKDTLANSSDEISDDLQSMRIRLAVLKAKEQCEKTEGNQIRQEAIDEVDSNLREILALESPCTNETLPNSPNKQKDVKKNTLPTKKSTPVSTNIEKEKLDGQIGSQIDSIISTYSKIFQALIVLINEHHLNQHVPRSSTSGSSHRHANSSSGGRWPSIS